MKILLFICFFINCLSVKSQTSFQYDVNGNINSIKYSGNNSCNGSIIGSYNEDATVRIYPNPTNSILYAQTSSLDIFITAVTVYSVSGQLLINKKYDNNNFVQVDVSMLPEATYIINFMTTTKRTILKFIKIRL